MSSTNHFLINNKAEIGCVEIKSKFDAEFRRFSLDGAKYTTFESFQQLLAQVHLLDPASLTFHVFYVDPKDNDLLPITNTDNYRRALQSARPLLRLVIQRQGECEDSYYRRTVVGNTSMFTSMLGGTPKPHKNVIPISKPTEFRQVRNEFNCKFKTKLVRIWISYGNPVTYIDRVRLNHQTLKTL